LYNLFSVGFSFKLGITFGLLFFIFFTNISNDNNWKNLSVNLWIW
jgi:hypothetical protein